VRLPFLGRLVLVVSVFSVVISMVFFGMGGGSLVGAYCRGVVFRRGGVFDLHSVLFRGVYSVIWGGCTHTTAGLGPGYGLGSFLWVVTGRGCIVGVLGYHFRVVFFGVFLGRFSLVVWGGRVSVGLGKGVGLFWVFG